MFKGLAQVTRELLTKAEIYTKYDQEGNLGIYLSALNTPEFKALANHEGVNTEAMG